MESVYAEELYDFLSEIEAIIRPNADPQVVQGLELARLHYKIPTESGLFVLPLTSEFYGEAIVALRLIEARCGDMLSAQELKRVRERATALKEQWFT